MKLMKIIIKIRVLKSKKYKIHKNKNNFKILMIQFKIKEFKKRFTPMIPMLMMMKFNYFKKIKMILFGTLMLIRKKTHSLRIYCSWMYLSQIFNNYDLFILFLKYKKFKLFSYIIYNAKDIYYLKINIIIIL